jgi:hypothetical protein
MKALLAAAEQQMAPAQAVCGDWYKVSLIPDMRAGDRFNVGVVFRDDLGTLNFRFLAHFERLRCLYGDKIEEQTRFLLQVLREHLVDEASLSTLPSSNLCIEGPFYSSGDSIDGILKSLYDAVVPIGRAPEDPEARQESAFQSINNQKARSLVYTQLDTILSLDKTHTLIPKVEYLELNTPDGKRRLDIPLRPYNHYGSIVSACFKRQSAIEQYVLKAQLDLATAHRLKPVGKPMGLFILRPNEDMRLTKDELLSADNVLDQLLWKIKTDQYRIEADDSPNRLAEEIADWAEV